MKKYRLFTASWFLITLLLALTTGESVAQVVDQQDSGQNDSTKEEQCEKAIKSCKDVKVGKTWSDMRTSCRKLRLCNKNCRKSKRFCKQSARSTKRDCKKECKSKRGPAKRRCKKECRKDFRGSKKDCRGEKRDCKHECRNHYKGIACRNARNAFLKSLPKAVECAIDGNDCLSAATGEDSDE